MKSRTLADVVGVWCWRAIAYGGMAALCGCTTLSTQVLPWQEEELSMVPHEGTLVPDENGNLVAPLRPPAELAKVSLPEYRLEPPDVLILNATRLVPKSPYFLQTLDILQIQALPTPAEAPIAGSFQIEPTGMVNLGPTYGAVRVVDLTPAEAQAAIAKQLDRQIPNAQVSVSILQLSGQEQIANEHLVGPDGTVTLGSYGSVYVAGMTKAEAKAAIEQYLAKFLDRPEVSLDVFAYNSKAFYVVREGAGFGDSVTRQPITGNDTVLDAIASVGGLDRVASRRMWIARPTHPGAGCDQILPIDWDSMVQGGSAATNYQLLPGDRLFIAEDRWLAVDGFVGKLTQPFERVLGFSLLGSQTVQTLQRFGGF
ncbi:MAG: polysaccharide biosynthesis/export family protein [Planctomycetota bacterium]|nr:polysaccharide biosynthesis/export family protein [Planctomycetota bacterium]